MQLDLFFLPNFALNNLTPYFMKLKKVLFGLCLVIFLSGEAKSEESSSNGQRTTLTQEKSNKNRPGLPSKVYVECIYDEGYLSFSFPGGIVAYTVRVYDDTDEWYGYVCVDEPMVQVPLFTGVYSVECIANDGRVFKGTITF